MWGHPSLASSTSPELGPEPEQLRLVLGGVGGVRGRGLPERVSLVAGHGGAPGQLAAGQVPQGARGQLLVGVQGGRRAVDHRALDVAHQKPGQRGQHKQVPRWGKGFSFIFTAIDDNWRG